MVLYVPVFPSPGQPVLNLPGSANWVPSLGVWNPKTNFFKTGHLGRFYRIVRARPVRQLLVPLFLRRHRIRERVYTFQVCLTWRNG